jgi:hypothetical protein
VITNRVVGISALATSRRREVASLDWTVFPVS